MNKYTVKHQLPNHYVEHYPKFVRFMELYYEWQTKHGLTAEEMQLLLDDDLTNVDVDKYIQTGDQQYMSSVSHRSEELIRRVDNKTPLEESNAICDDYLLKRKTETYSTSDGYIFECADDDVYADRSLYVSDVADKHIDQWHKFHNFPVTHNESIDAFVAFFDKNYNQVKDSDDKKLILATYALYGRYQTLDSTLLLKLLRSIYSIKGTRQSILLFFNIFFGEPVTITYPKRRLCIADGDSATNGMIPDGINVLRDDDVYQEFSILIETAKDPSEYQYMVDKIYKPIFHPSGFRLEIRKRI